MTEPRLTRIFGKDEDSELSYALEFKTSSIDTLEKWNEMEGRKLYSLILNKFKQNILGFATLMQLIDP